ncbi:MAG: sensor histidine kinase [Armatimonadota bacterium]
MTGQWFTQALLAQLALLDETFQDRNSARDYHHHVSLRMGHAIGERYRTLNQLDYPLSDSQFVHLLYEISSLMEGALTVSRHAGHAIVLHCRDCSLEEQHAEMPGLCRLIIGMYGALAAWNYGYARAVVTNGIGCTSRAGGCRLHLYLPPDRGKPHATSEVFTREEMASLVRDSQLALQATQRPRLMSLSSLRDVKNLMYLKHRDIPPVRQGHDDLLSKVSHELRTPITTLHGYLSLLQQEILGGVNPEQQGALAVALRNIERLNRLVNDLLDYASLASGEFTLGAEPVDIAEVCQSSLQHSVLEAMRKGISIEHQVPEGIGMVLGDRRRLVQVLEHLLENAIKFSNTGASVWLRAYRAEPQVHLEVRDTGIGMTHEQLQRVFAPFVQGENGLTRRYEGLGMGLSLIQSLVKLHGGDIDINSQPGQGTTVRVILPLVAE